MTAGDLAGVAEYRSNLATKKRTEYETQLNADLESAITPLTNELVKVNGLMASNKYTNGTADTTPKSKIPDYNPSSSNGGGSNNNKQNDKNTTSEKTEVDLLQLLKSTIINGNNLDAYNKEYQKQSGNELNSKNYWDDLT